MYPTNEKLKTFFDRNTIDTNKQGINQYFGDSENMLVDMSKISSPDMSDTQHEQRVANSLKLSETYGITYGDAYKSFPQWAKHYCGSEKDEDVYRAISLSYFPEEKSPLPEANTLFNLFSPSDEAPKESQVDATAFEAVGQFAFDFMESSVGGAYRLLGQPEMANEAVKRIEAYRPELSSQTQQTLTSDEWAADPRFWLYQGTSLGMQILPIVKTAQIASSIPYAFQLGAKAAKGMAYANSVTATAYYIANQNGTQAVSEAQQKGIEEEKLNNVYTETFVPSLYINLAANALGFMTGQFGEGAKGIKKLAGKGLGGFLAGAVGTEGELREQEAQEKAIANNLDVMIKTLPWWRPRTYEALMGDDPEKFKLATIAFIGESVGDSVVGHIISTSRSQGDRVLQRMYDTAKQQYGSKYINSFETPMEFVTDFQKRSEADSLKAATTIKAHLESKEQLNTIFTQASRELYEFEVMEKEGKTLTTEQSRAKEVNKAIDFYRKNPKKLLQDAGMDTPTSYLDFVKKHSALLKEHVSKISMTKMRSVGSAIGEGLEVVRKRIQLSAKKFVDAKGDYNKFKESMRKSLGVAIDPHLSELYSNAEKLLNSEALKQEIKAKALYEVMKKRFPDSYKPELKKISDAYTKRISTNNLIALQQEMQDASTEQETMEMVSDESGRPITEVAEKVPEKIQQTAERNNEEVITPKRTDLNVSTAFNKFRVIDAIIEEGGIAGKPKGQKGSNYDGFIPLTETGGLGQYFYRKGGWTDLDVLAQILYDKHVISEPNTDALWEELRGDIFDYRQENEAVKHDNRKRLTEVEKQGANFETDTANKKGKNTKKVSVAELSIGDVIEIMPKGVGKPEKMTVVEIDADTYAMTLEGGDTYGRQILDSNKTIFVNKLKRVVPANIEHDIMLDKSRAEYNKMVVDELSSLAKINLSAKESKSYIENIIEPMATKNITPKMIGEQLNYFNTTQFEKTKTTAKKATPFSVGRKQGVVSQQSKIKNLQAEVASFIRRNTDLNKNLDALRKKANFTKNKEQTIGDLTKQAREAFKGIKLPASILTKIKDVSIATEKTFDNKLGAAINAIESASRDKRNSLAYKSIISSLKKIKKAKSTPQVIKNLDVPSQKALMDTDFTNEIMDAIDEGIKISVDEADIPKWVTTAIDNLYGYSGKKNTVGAMSDSKLRVFVEVMDFYRQVRNNPQKELKAKFEKLVNNAASKIHKEQHSFFSKRNKLQEHIFELPDGKIINTWYQDYWKNYNNWMLTPEVLMWKLDGNKYGTLSKVFSENMQHSESLKDSVQRAFYELDEAVFGRKREKINDLKWGQSEHEFTDANGKKFMLSKYEVISMYLTAEQELGLNHLLKGGVRQQSKKGGISHHKINDATLQTMYKIMNSNTDLMTVASHTRDSYNMLSAYLNERSRGLVGYDIATVPDYFPLFVSKGDTNAYNEIYKPTTSINDIKEFMATTAATMNPYKQRDQKSNSPIMIGNARNILMGSLKKDSQYYGFAEAYRLGDAVLRNKTHGLEKALTNTYGSQSWKALNQLMTDLKTNKYQQTMDSWVGSCINTLTKGALSFNVPVMFMQPVSYNIARGEIETKYWSKGLVNLPKYIKSNLATKFDFMGKYSSNLFMRYRGQIGWSAGEALGKIADVKTKVGKVAQTGMKGIQHNDNATISAIWDAVTAEVEATQPTLTGDNKWDAVARRTEQVVHRTQPTFYRTDRPALARSGSFLAILTMRFSSQLIKNYALEVQSFTNLVQKQNTDMAMRTLTSLGISMVQIMLIKALVSAARREATEEIFNSRENKDFAENLISQMKSQSLGVATAATGQLGSLLLGIIAQTGYKKSGISEPISSAGAQLVRGILGIGELGLDFITEKRDNRGRLLWKKNLPREIYQLGRASSLASGVGGGDFWTLGSYMLSQNINKR